MNSRMYAIQKSEKRALKTVRKRRLEFEEPVAPGPEEELLLHYQEVYGDLRALLRIPPGDDIRDHYFRIYTLGNPFGVGPE